MISDPSGRFIYITRPQRRTVDVYRVTTSGSLKALSSPTSLPQTPSRLLCPPSGPFLYVVSRNDSSLTQLRRDKDGLLHMAHFFRFADVNPERAVDPRLVILPNGRFLYVGDEAHSTLQQYAHWRRRRAPAPVAPHGRLRARRHLR